MRCHFEVRAEERHAIGLELETIVAPDPNIPLTGTQTIQAETERKLPAIPAAKTASPQAAADHALMELSRTSRVYGSRRNGAVL